MGGVGRQIYEHTHTEDQSLYKLWEDLKEWSMSWKEAQEKPELHPMVFASFEISIISGNTTNKIRGNNNIIIIIIVINNETSFVYFQ